MRKLAYRSTPSLRASLALCLLALLSACEQRDGSPPGSSEGVTHLPSDASPLGELAGTAQISAGDYGGDLPPQDAASVAEGRRLYVAMNCAGCHGYGAKGAMGPDLTDPLWRYGGTPAAIYRSIFEGRPQGMPAWGRSLPPQTIWKITAYVRTLGGALDASEYHAGLQGDHDVTAVAPDAQGPDTTPPQLHVSHE